PDHLRREHVGLRARLDGRRLLVRIPQRRGGGVHLRPIAAQPQGQFVRPAPQIRRRDAPRGGDRASRRAGARAQRGVSEAIARRPLHSVHLRNASIPVAVRTNSVSPSHIVLFSFRIRPSLPTPSTSRSNSVRSGGLTVAITAPMVSPPASAK